MRPRVYFAARGKSVRPPDDAKAGGRLDDPPMSERMKVLVSGGTGFVGSHSVKALRDAGHRVRLLVRDPARIERALAPLGVAAPEHVVGDVTDPESVRRALDGCDGVLHAASVYSLDPRRGRGLRRDNARGTELVLGTAQELGLDPIVHVSSYVAMLPAHGTLTPDAPVGAPRGAYARSKAETERLARELQREGAPVVITHPGMVWGPHDPHMGESATLARAIVRGQMPLVPRGSAPVTDVRDVAAVHAAVMRPGRGPRRYLAAGPSVPFSDIVAAVRAATGRRLPAVAVRAPLLLGMVWPVEMAQRALPFRVPVGTQGPWIAWRGVPVDASATERELGVRFRPAGEAVGDTVRWLLERAPGPAEAPAAVAAIQEPNARP
jgi:dihydroflavonol-4-reductase